MEALRTIEVRFARLDMKLVNILQGNKTITFGAPISTNQKSYGSIMEKKICKFTCNFTKSEPVSMEISKSNAGAAPRE